MQSVDYFGYVVLEGKILEGYTFKDDSDGRPAGIFKFDLDSGKLIKKFILEDKGGVHFFNDLVSRGEW